VGRILVAGAFGVLIVFAFGGFATPARADELTGVWGPPTLVERSDVGDAFDPQVVFDPMGNAIAVWGVVGGNLTTIWANRYVPGWGWGTPERIGDGDPPPEFWPSPRLVADSTGTVISVWTMGGDLWANSFRPWAGWGIPRSRSTPGLANVADVFASSGRAVVVWRDDTSNPFESTVWAAEFVPETGWGTPSLLEAGSNHVHSLRVAASNAGDAIAAWVRGPTSPGNDPEFGIMASRFVPGMGWGTPIRLADGPVGSFGPNIAAGPAGPFVVAWNNETGAWATVFLSGLGWLEPTRSPARDGRRWDLGVTVDRYGTATLTGCLYSGRFECLDLAVERLSPERGWEGATTLRSESIDPEGIPERSIFGFDEAVTPSDGRIVVWREFSNHGGGIWPGRLWASWSRAGNEWGAPVPISDASADSETIGQPSVAVDAFGAALVVWSQHDGARHSIWSSRFSPLLVWDVIAPSLTLTSPTDGMTTDTAVVTVGGVTEPGVRLVVNGILVAVAADGSFSFPLALFPGTNEITAMATDAAGNAAKISFHVTYRPAVPPVIEGSPDPLSPVLVAVGTTVAALVGPSVVLSRRRRRRDTADGGPITRKHPDAISPEERREATASPVPAPAFRKSGDGENPWPASKSAALRLTAKERILLLLFAFARHAEAPEVPSDLTQGSIALAAGVDRRHFTQYVRPLLKEGLVRERTTHVQGALQRRKVYVITEVGRRKALAIRDRLRLAAVLVQDAAGTRESTLGEVLVAANGSKSLLEIVRESLRSEVVDLTALPPNGPRSTELPEGVAE